MESTPSEIQLHLPVHTIFTQKDELDELGGSSLYVSVVCYIEVAAQQRHSPDILRFAYNQIQMATKSQQLSATWKLLVYVGLPGFVGLVVLVLALRFCVRRIYMADTKLVEEEPGPTAQTEGVVIIPSTADVLAPDTGLMSVPEKHPDVGTGMMSLTETVPNSGNATPLPAEAEK